MEEQGLIYHYRSIYRHQKQDFRTRALVRLVSEYFTNREPVLDLGCGTCYLTLHLLRNGFRVMAVDDSNEMVSMGCEILKEEGFDSNIIREVSITELAESKDEQFSQIACIDVLDHIEDDKANLAAIFKLLKCGGRLVLAVPALPHLYGARDIELGHYRRYSKPSLMKLLKTQHCNIVSLRYWNFIGVPLTWIYSRILEKKINESFRQNEKGVPNKSIASFLRFWFIYFENNVYPPTGLTLIAVVEKDKFDYNATSALSN